MTGLLGMDASTSVVGWAAGSETTKFLSGSITAPKNLTLGERLNLIYSEVDSLVLRVAPDLIMVEEPFFPIDMQRGFDKPAAPGEQGEPAPKKKRAAFDPATIKALQKVAGILEAVAAKHSIPLDFCQSQAWRRTFFGFGAAPKGDPSWDWKREAIRRARALGYDPQNADEAEAIGVTYHGLHGAPAAERKQGDLLAMAKSSL